MYHPMSLITSSERLYLKVYTDLLKSASRIALTGLPHNISSPPQGLTIGRGKYAYIHTHNNIKSSKSEKESYSISGCAYSVFSIQIEGHTPPMTYHPLPWSCNFFVSFRELWHVVYDICKLCPKAVLAS